MTIPTTTASPACLPCVASCPRPNASANCSPPPSGTSGTSRRVDSSSQISESETSRESIQGQILSARKEVEDLEERRVELQEMLNTREMVLIPENKVRIGTSDPTREDENPEHRVLLSAFYMDKTEVTNLQYKEFVAVTGHRSPSHWRFNTFPDARKADHPVVNVSWEDARIYAEWIGKRLSTEAEWERAALSDGRDEYPWGRTCNPDYAKLRQPRWPDDFGRAIRPRGQFCRRLGPVRQRQ